MREISLLNKEHSEQSNQIMEQYKMYVEMADRVSQRRINVNTFFLSANIIVLTIVGIKGFEVKKYSLVIMIVGIILSYTWNYLLESYKLLNSRKFEIIQEVEQLLPLNLYIYEWEKLGEGRNRARYWPVSNIEKIIPFLFAVVYVLFELVVILGG